MSENSMRPLTGLRVVEVAAGVSVVGAGMATSIPGALLRDLGADICRVQSRSASTLDQGVEFARSRDRGKEIVEVEGTDGQRLADTVKALAREADVLILGGAEAVLERRGIVHADRKSVV